MSWTIGDVGGDGAVVVTTVGSTPCVFAVWEHEDALTIKNPLANSADAKCFTSISNLAHYATCAERQN